ncbi:MAG: fasciclin domain-containing protein, partial [Chloroflexi bacterium]|nr:fasciclin domain-containing protein [Chloroflexota bacterium]
MFKKNRLIGLLMILALIAMLVLAACGDDDDGDDDTPEPAAQSETGNGAASDEGAEDTAETETGPALVSIPDTLISQQGRQDEPTFLILLQAIADAGLSEDLAEGEYTLFAPTDAAFMAAAQQLDALTIEMTETGEVELTVDSDFLTRLLSYHLVEGTVMSAALNPDEPVVTVETGTITVAIDGDAVTLTDESGGTANVAMPDIVAANGVIHVIDAVLLPQPTLVEVAAGRDDLTTVVGLLSDNDLLSALEDEVTVFAPNNAAFELIAADLEGFEEDVVVTILQNHVVEGVYSGAELAADPAPVFMTLADNELVPTVEGEDLAMIDGIMIVGTLPADNGVIYVIDAVLVPPAPEVVEETEEPDEETDEVVEEAVEETDEVVEEAVEEAVEETEMVEEAEEAVEEAVEETEMVEE